MKKKVSAKCCSLNGSQLGLTLGIFFAAIHAIWAVLVASGRAQAFIDLVMPLHFLDMVYTITQFSLGVALTLVVLAFVCGYLMGWLFAALWNWTSKS